MSRNKKDSDHRLVDSKQYSAIEAFRALRTNLEFTLPDDGNKVIIVTSSLAGEGKTDIIANLGIFLTYTGHSVLLIDCDLRNPVLHKYFKVSNEAGVTKVIKKRMPLHEAIQDVRKGLSILCSGPIPPNPVELLDSLQMQNLIKEVSGEFDYVLIDTPPSLKLSDAAVISCDADGVLLVIKHSSTPIGIVSQAINNLQKVKANILGVVLSQTKGKGKYGYYRDRYYDRYYVQNK